MSPVSGMTTRNTTARPATTRSRTVPSERKATSLDLLKESRSRKTSTHSRKPGRKSTPKRTVTRVSLRSRALRSPLADRQCSTTVCGSRPKDWMSAPRPPPSVRSWTARQKASPRFGLKYSDLNSLELPVFTSDLCHSLLALRISVTSLSRYAAEARALVATACPPEP